LDEKTPKQKGGNESKKRKVKERVEIQIVEINSKEKL